MLKHCLQQIQAFFGHCEPSAEAAAEAEGDPKASLISGEAAEEAKPADVSKRVWVVLESQLFWFQQIPFDVSKKNLHHLERLFDIGFGHSVHDPKLLAWLLTTLSQ
jgi:hypothetical protein